MTSERRTYRSQKPGRLNDDDERALIEIHPMSGYEALAKQDGISAEILDAIRHHHEYLDGSGYPDGLSGKQHLRPGPRFDDIRHFRSTDRASTLQANDAERGSLRGALRDV